MVVFVLRKAWPSFAHNGCDWFGAGGNVDQQLGGHLQLAGANPTHYDYRSRAWPLI